MIWKGADTKTVDGLFRAMSRCDTRDEAQELREKYLETHENTEVGLLNLGYMTGYADRVTGARWRDWFDVKHPIWDFDAEPNPTFEQMVEAGATYMATRIEEGKHDLGNSHEGHHAEDQQPQDG